MPKVFISYRRGDSAGHAGRLYDRVVLALGSENVFMDVDALRPGEDFVEAIHDRLKNCDVMLVVIGARWLEAEEGGRSRLENAADFVRIEIQAALERNIRVVPILVQGATMPRREDLPEPLHGLVRRHAIELSDTRWSFDIARLIEGIQIVSPAAAAPVSEQSTASPGPSVSRARRSKVNDQQDGTNVLRAGKKRRTRSPGTRARNLAKRPPATPAPTEPTPPAAPRNRSIDPGIRSTRTAPATSTSSSSARESGVASVQLNDDLLGRIEFANWIPDSLAVSSDSRRVAWISKKPKFLNLWQTVVVIVDGKASREYDDVVIKTLRFSANSQRCAFVAKSGVKWRVVVDGREERLYDDVGIDPVFSPDARRVAYCARSGGKWTVVLDGQETGHYDAILANTPMFSPDGRRVVYGAGVGDKWTVVVDGQEVGRYEGISADALTFSPDGQRVAYGARVGDNWTVVVDGQEVGRYDGVLKRTPIFSPDGRRVAYGAGVGGKMTVVVDGQETGLYDGISADALAFSPDGHRVAYGARVGDKWTVVVDGQEAGRYDDILAGTLIFSPDGRRVVYGAYGDGKWAVVVDGQESDRYDTILAAGAPIFSPDGRRLVYDASVGGKWMLVVEGHKCPMPGPSLRGSRFAFEDNDTLRLLTVNDAGEIRRVIARIT